MFKNVKMVEWRMADKKLKGCDKMALYFDMVEIKIMRINQGYDIWYLFESYVRGELLQMNDEKTTIYVYYKLHESDDKDRSYGSNYNNSNKLVVIMTMMTTMIKTIKVFNKQFLEWMFCVKLKVNWHLNSAKKIKGFMFLLKVISAHSRTANRR